MQKSLAHKKWGSSLPIYPATLMPYEIISDHLCCVCLFFSRPQEKTPSAKHPLVERMCPRKSRAELMKSQ